MPQLSSILDDFIIKSKEKLNQSNLKTYCKCCIEALGEEEGKKAYEIFSLSKSNEKQAENRTENQQAKRSFLQSSDSYDASSVSSRKVILRTSYGPLDNFIVRSLSNEDIKKFHILLIRLTVSCDWALHWVNNPEAKELFEFLNPFLKLPDRHTLGGEILQDAVSEEDKAMQIVLKEDPISITLTFDGWTNVKNEQLLGVVVMTSEGRPYVWRADDISSERETHVELFAINFKPPFNQVRKKTGDQPCIKIEIFEIIDSSTF
ncbi:unnamed protein product [Rhizophagus irregularis]|nr:unnamed protein product [Rhizophagus irregularis]